VFSSTLILSGAMNTGRDIAAARMMGADLAYLGSRFIATRESLVGEEQRAMMLASQAADIVYTPRVSGVNASFMRASLEANGLLDESAGGHPNMNLEHEARAWKTVWSAGQGVGSIRDVPPAAELCQRLIAEYRAAVGDMATDPFRG
jgi:nitronate monooxygenase